MSHSMSREMRGLGRFFSATVSAVFLLSLVSANIVRVSAATDCTVSDKLVNSCRPWLGAAANKYPQADSNVQAQMLYHEQRIGKQVDIVHTYHGVGSNVLSAEDAYFATRAGTMLFTDWKPASTWTTASGGNATANANIDKMAASIKALGSSKIFMTVWHEPENDVSSAANCPGVATVGTAGTPTQYKSMWQNVQNRFRNAGVSNVVWVYDVMNYDPYDCLVGELYPGDNLVDWVMFNAYGGPKQQNYVANVSHMYDYLTTHSTAAHNYLSKPWGIVEWNIRNATTDQGTQYYDAAKAALDNNTFPLLKAYMVFDSVGPDGNENRVAYDTAGVWSDAKHQHYIDFADDPIFNRNTQPPAADATSPVATLSAPLAGATVNGMVQVSGSATDDTAVTSLSLLVDGTLYPFAVSAPFDAAMIGWNAGTVANGAHTLQFEAADATGNLGRSATVSVIVANPDTTAPSVPNGLQAVIVSNSSLQLSWNPAADANAVTGYNVYRDNVLVATVTDGSTYYSDTGLQNSVAYQYSVSAYDADGNTSAESALLSVMIQDTTPPASPAGLSYTELTSTSVGLSWQTASDDIGVTAYDVLRDGVVIATVTAPGYVDSQVEQGLTYSYTVVARDAAGNASPASSALVLTVPDTIAPSMPVYPAANLTGTTVNLSWQDSYDNVGVVLYKVMRDGIVIGTSAGTTYVDSTGQQGRTYIYTVQAIDAAGNTSAASLGASATVPDITAPTVPGKPIAKLNSNSTITITWTAATDNVGVDHYEVWRLGVYQTNVSGLTYTDTTVKQGTSYIYKLYAVDATGNRSAVSSASASLLVPDTTAPTTAVNLAGTSTVVGTVKLTWAAATDNVGVTGYDVYRGTSKVATVSGTTVTYSVTGLTSGTSYKFSVQAFDAAGNLSPMSTQITVKAK